MASRQREWQLRMEMRGLCILCGQPVAHNIYCQTHYEARRKRRHVAHSTKRCGHCGEAGHNIRGCSLLYAPPPFKPRGETP